MGYHNMRHGVSMRTAHQHYRSQVKLLVELRDEDVNIRKVIFIRLLHLSDNVC